WLRRIVYFATLAASLHLALFWRFHDINPQREYNTALWLVPQTVGFFETFLPRQAVRWGAEYFAPHPIYVLCWMLVLITVVGFGSRLESQITDRMRTIWTSRSVKPTIQQSVLQYAIYAFRTSRPYQTVLRWLRYYVLPFVSALVLLWLGLAGLDHLAWNIADPFGGFCSPTKGNLTPIGDGKAEAKDTLATNAPCFGTGLKLTKGAP